MGDAGLSQGFVDAQLGGHDGVISGGEHRVHLLGDQGLGGQVDLISGGAGLFNVLDVCLVQIGLGFGDGLGGGVLAVVIEQAHIITVGVGSGHQLEDGTGVQGVRGAGDVTARFVHGVHPVSYTHLTLPTNREV